MKRALSRNYHWSSMSPGSIRGQASDKALGVFFGLMILLLAGVWFSTSDNDTSPTEEMGADVASLKEPVAKGGVEANKYIAALTSKPKAVDEAVGKEPAGDVGAAVADSLMTLDELYVDVPPMDFDSAKALILQRKETAGKLSGELAAMGARAVPGILSAFENAEKSKTKLFLIEALSKNKSAESVVGLETIANSEAAFSFKEQAMSAIAGHASGEAELVLAKSLVDNQDERLSVIAVKGLSRYPESLPFIVETIESEGSELVKLASVRAVGKFGTIDARTSLERVATSSDSVKVRKNAIMELARSFGDDAGETLSLLVNDVDSEIAKTAERAIQMMNRQSKSEGIP